MVNYFVFSFKSNAREIGLSLCTGVLGFITLDQVPLLLTIIGTAIGTTAMPVYYGWKRYRKQEERERESAVIKAIKDLRDLGFIDPEEPAEEQHRKAVDWLSKPIKE